MKTTVKKYIGILSAAFAGMALTACSDFLTEYSQDLAKVESWQDLDEVLLGDAYMQSSRVSFDDDDASAGDNLDILHVMSDELKEAIEYDCMDMLDYKKSLFAFHTWQQDTGFDEKLKYRGGDDEYWNNIYTKINVCNMVIALIDEQPEPKVGDGLQKERVKGEAYFLRGAYYFLLANLYAQPYVPSTAASVPGVPVKTSEYVEDIEYTRETLAQTYERIVNDLAEAEHFLEGKGRKSVYRADVTAARLLMSRVCLYMQDWPGAVKYARLALDGQDALLDLHGKTAGDNCIYRDSPETIFTMGSYAMAAEFSYGRSFGINQSPAYYISDEMMELFDRSDLRSNLYVGKTEKYNYSPVFTKLNGQQSAWGPYYEVSSSFLLRTPEAYLTLAEASAFNDDESTAREYLERFLATRKLTSVTVSESGNDLIDLIRAERAREFLMEGHRWFDLRRYCVCVPYPWSKEIVHSHGYYDSDRYDVDYVDSYRLEPYDKAYTLPIPRTVRNFQISIGNNERPERPAFMTEKY